MKGWLKKSLIFWMAQLRWMAQSLCDWMVRRLCRRMAQKIFDFLESSLRWRAHCGGELTEMESSLRWMAWGSGGEFVALEGK